MSSVSLLLFTTVKLEFDCALTHFWNLTCSTCYTMTSTLIKYSAKFLCNQNSLGNPLTLQFGSIKNPLFLCSRLSSQIPTCWGRQLIDQLYRAHKACLIQPRECLGLRSLLSFGGINTYLRPLPRASAGLEFFHSVYTPGAVPPLLTRCAHDSLRLKCCSFFFSPLQQASLSGNFPCHLHPSATPAPPQPRPSATPAPPPWDKVSRPQLSVLPWNGPALFIAGAPLPSAYSAGNCHPPSLTHRVKVHALMNLYNLESQESVSFLVK